LKEYPLAVTSEQFRVGEGDRLVLILRSVVWDERNVQDLMDALDRIQLGGRYAILYLDKDDEVHVVAS
jgi:hypothetical protein